MGFAKQIKAYAVIHCGDWNTLESVETVISFGIPLYAVVGNADIADDVKNKFPEFLEVKIDNLRIGVCHSIVNCKLKIENSDVVFYGHTHRQEDKIINGVRCVNPGALENGINFAIYDTTSDKIEFIHED
jgi:putative phosphoesterase